nr:hypothetical protein Ade03nite_94620 [Actinoplanes derwentensis]
MFFDKPGGGQFGEQWLNPGCGVSAEAGGSGDGHLRARMQSEEPEQPGRRRADRLVGPGQNGPDVSGRIIGGERVQGAVGFP